MQLLLDERLGGYASCKCSHPVLSGVSGPGVDAPQCCVAVCVCCAGCFTECVESRDGEGPVQRVSLSSVFPSIPFSLCERRQSKALLQKALMSQLAPLTFVLKGYFSLNTD